jgi:hypothetical protein
MPYLLQAPTNKRFLLYLRADSSVYSPSLFNESTIMNPAKFSLEQTMKAERESSGIALHFV